MTYATPPMLSDSAAVRGEGNALDADPATEDPPTVPHNEMAHDFSAAVERLLIASSQAPRTR